MTLRVAPDERRTLRTERAQAWEKRFEIPTLVAALLVIPVIVVEESGLGGLWSAFATLFNWLIWLTFFAEAAIVLTITPARWQWARSHPLQLFVVVLTPPFLPAALQGTRLLRLLRLGRLAITIRFVREPLLA